MQPRQYAMAFAALLVLTAISFAASYLRLDAFEVPVALGIAAVKSGIVILVFMHLAGGAFAYRLALLVGVLFVGIMLAFTLLDLVTRPPLVSPA